MDSPRHTPITIPPDRVLSFYLSCHLTSNKTLRSFFYINTSRR
jgi:hypothetical protein